MQAWRIIVQGLGTQVANFNLKEMKMQHCNLAGIDVGSKALVVKFQKGKSDKLSDAIFDNNTTGHKKLLKYLTKSGSDAKVCVEATGVYHFDLSLLLHKSKKVKVMVSNPRAIKHFSIAVMKRAKTDKADAEVILKYLKVCDFVQWVPPEDHHIVLQKISRRMHQVKNNIQREQCRLEASESCDIESKFIVKVTKQTIKHFEKQLKDLEAEALTLIAKDGKLQRIFHLLISVSGIAKRSAILILGELACMPSDMTSSQWVAYAGLDPRAFESGESINKPRRISKCGNKYLRAALYMPSWVAVQRDEHVRAHFIKLRERNILKMKAITAVTRKLLICIWGMLHHDQPWDSSKYHAEGVELSVKLPE